jgi:hypothetical protein
MMGAASRFRLDKMKAQCEMLLAESISKEDARMTLKLARNHGCSKLARGLLRRVRVVGIRE